MFVVVLYFLRLFLFAPFFLLECPFKIAHFLYLTNFSLYLSPHLVSHIHQVPCFLIK